MKKFCIFLSLSLLMLAPVFAARPLITDDFYTVKRGSYELEFGYFSIQEKMQIDNYLDLSFKRGIWDNLDFGIEIPYTTTNPAGLNDIYLHAKYRFWERSENEGATARVDYKFKNGSVSQGLGSGDNDYWLLLIYSKMFGKTKLHLNVGYVNVGIIAGQQYDDYLIGSAAVEQPVWNDRGELVAEYVSNNAYAPSTRFIQLGARYLVFEGFKLDAGYAFGLNDQSIKNSLTAGLHWEF